MANSEKFATWHKMECARRCGTLERIEKHVDDQMEQKNLRVDGFDKALQKWIAIETL